VHSVHRAQLALQRLATLSSPPGTVLRLLELTLSEPASLRPLVELVRTDPGLAVEVLRRLPAEVLKRRNALHIPNAVHALGLDGLRELALRTELRNESTAAAQASAASPSATSSHAIASAACAYELAVAIGRDEPEVAYAAGLLACVGSIALEQLFEAHAPELAARCSGQDPRRALEVERQALGVDHESLAVAIADGWNLPTEFQDVVACAYRTSEQLEHLAQSGVDTQLASLARAGQHLASLAGFPLNSGALRTEPPADVAALLDAVDVAQVLECAREAVESAAESASPSPRTPEQRFDTAQRIQRELRERLLACEAKLRAEQSVNTVLQYGLNRLGDGDPLPGVMFRAMEAMGFHRIACLEIDAAAAKLEVVSACAASGHSKVAEGLWAPFPSDRSQFHEPTIVTREGNLQAHDLVLELIGASSAAVAPLREVSPGKRLLLAADRGRAGRAPIAGEERCLGIIAEQLTLLLQYEELFKAKERMATQDPLTGAATRRRLMERLEFMATQSARTKLPFALLLMDLDHFKKFNDTMGHQVGDRLLQDVVNVLNTKVRRGDLVARYGGEEFIVVLPTCDIASAMAIAEDLRNAVADYGVEQRASYQGLPVSVSIGAAQWTPDESPLELIARADEALYASKRAGRNRVSAAA
jgi:diguanylate cyclase (GGDEF)-like protein